jgi:mono/diheme cytochrome c family protein
MATSHRIKIFGSALAALFALGLVISAARGDATSDQAEAAAVRRGAALFRQAWAPGAKRCFDCHGSGRNQLTSARLKSYPKYDPTWRQVVTAQQKLNQMIKGKSGGEPLVLGSDDLNALESYIAGLR